MWLYHCIYAFMWIIYIRIVWNYAYACVCAKYKTTLKQTHKIKQIMISISSLHSHAWNTRFWYLKIIPFALCYFYVEETPLPAVGPDSCRMQVGQKLSSLSPPAQLLKRKSISKSEMLPVRCLPIISRLESLGTGRARAWLSVAVQIGGGGTSRQARANRWPCPTTATCPLSQQPKESLAYALLPRPHPSFIFLPRLSCLLVLSGP